MKIKSIKLTNFKRFTGVTIKDLPETAKLVVMIGPNGSGKSSVFDALNCYTYIVKNNAYPSDDVNVSPFESMYMMNHYLKNDQPHLHMSAEDLASRGMEVGKSLLADCLNIVTHHEQEVKVDELRVHTRSSHRNYLMFLHSDLFSTLSAEKLRLKLSKLPTEKEEDHTFALNRWALFNYEITYQLEIGNIFEDHRPAPPYELKKYAETVLRYKKEIIEEVSEAIAELFINPLSKLILEDILHLCLSISDPELSYFNERRPPFYNLSVGEIAIFDLLLDIIIKKVIDDETVICIDEPELHIHTKLQGQFLQELYDLISPKSQLWIATHSVGMARKAQDLWRENPASVVLLDFSNHNFDEQVTLKPIVPDPDFWERTYEVALGDLAGLVASELYIFCEGEGFDEVCYKNIFASHYPEARFVSVGGSSTVKNVVKTLRGKIVKGAKVIGIVDRDRTTEAGIKRNAEKGIRTLEWGEIEDYLIHNVSSIKDFMGFRGQATPP